uniref:Uncharacterized protein n=2 Tax=Caenorhabditis japonica TaxID=281687 RepID=A0A8R1HL40_CAEJA
MKVTREEVQHHVDALQNGGHEASAFLYLINANIPLKWFQEMNVKEVIKKYFITVNKSKAYRLKARIEKLEFQEKERQMNGLALRPMKGVREVVEKLEEEPEQVTSEISLIKKKPIRDKYNPLTMFKTVPQRYSHLNLTPGTSLIIELDYWTKFMKKGHKNCIKHGPEKTLLHLMVLRTSSFLMGYSKEYRITTKLRKFMIDKFCPCVELAQLLFQEVITMQADDIEREKLYKKKRKNRATYRGFYAISALKERTMKVLQFHSKEVIVDFLTECSIPLVVFRDLNIGKLAQDMMAQPETECLAHRLFEKIRGLEADEKLHRKTNEVVQVAFALPIMQSSAKEKVIKPANPNRVPWMPIFPKPQPITEQSSHSSTLENDESDLQVTFTMLKGKIKEEIIEPNTNRVSWMPVFPKEGPITEQSQSATLEDDQPELQVTFSILQAKIKEEEIEPNNGREQWMPVFPKLEPVDEPFNFATWEELPDFQNSDNDDTCDEIDDPIESDKDLSSGNATVQNLPSVDTGAGLKIDNGDRKIAKTELVDSNESYNLLLDLKIEELFVKQEEPY